MKTIHARGVGLVMAALSLLSPPMTAQQSGAVSTPDPLVAHVLNRLAFGPRPGDVARVTAMGVDRWIAQQLTPPLELDAAAMDALIGCPLWRDPLDDALAAAWERPQSYTVRLSNDASPGSVMTATFAPNSILRVVPRDSARIAGRGYIQAGQLMAGRLTRAEATDQQLLEVMTDFWENHFSIFAERLQSRGTLVEWDRRVVRPNALGRFRDLLGAVAHSPAMLAYLDNAVSSDTGRNENYARELLELHTLGVDGGYAQSDVEHVARALTGWTHTGITEQGRPVSSRTITPIEFLYWEPWHDKGVKIVLGDTLRAGRGIEDGEQVLDILARHPSTARFIARKLAVRFVSDDPPPALVERAAATYLRTSGSIREVLRTIFASAEFRSPSSYGAKVKSPVELVLSMRRALNAPPDTAAEMIDLLIELRQPPFGRSSPEGWPETGARWMDAGALMRRVQIGTRIGSGALPSIPVEGWREWKSLSAATFDRQVEAVINTLLSGRASPETRRVMFAVRPAVAAVDAGARERTLRELIGLALSSPEFQRR